MAHLLLLPTASSRLDIQFLSLMRPRAVPLVSFFHWLGVARSSLAGNVCSLEPLPQSIGSPHAGLLFQGHTSWQMSQPATHPVFEIAAQISWGAPSRSIFHVERHRRQSKLKGSRAFVGQASMHRVHEPHLSPSTGESGSISTSKSSTPRQPQLPPFPVIRSVFLPCQPRPALTASFFSKIGAVSTHTSPRASG